VLLPYPHHADRHQAVNAAPLVAAGAAALVGAQDPTGRGTAILLLEQCLGRLAAMSAAARRCSRPEASRLVAAIVRAAGHERRHRALVASTGESQA
jgi:UDP-N-acetylglucosamine:LPS N-acetylglucosamine transferase